MSKAKILLSDYKQALINRNEAQNEKFIDKVIRLAFKIKSSTRGLVYSKNTQVDGGMVAQMVEPLYSRSLVRVQLIPQPPQYIKTEKGSTEVRSHVLQT